MTTRTFNLTPMRVKLLRLLAERGRYRVQSLAEVIAPRRPGHTGKPIPWTEQGAARWAGGYVRQLERAGLVWVDRHVAAGVGIVGLTDAGCQALAQHELNS